MAKKLTPEEFYALPKRERALLVAKDVLRMLRRGNLRAACSTGYVRRIPWKSYEKALRSKSSHIATAKLMEQNCEVCALGACFISALRLGDRYKLPDNPQPESYDRREVLLDYPGIEPLLKKIFPPAQLREIEKQFEGYYRVNGDWALASDSDEEKLRKIMENIVENKGVFRPEQLGGAGEA